MSNETLMSVIDWDLEQGPFRDSINQLVITCFKLGKVIGLPVPLREAEPALLILLLSQVDCSGCSSRCCRIPDKDSEITVLPEEYAVLAPKHGAELFHKGVEGVYALPMPCPLLKGYHCSIYSERPLTCFFYPFQAGARDQEGDVMALASGCPEGRRIARQVYMTAWRMRRLALRAGLRMKLGV